MNRDGLDAINRPSTSVSTVPDRSWFFNGVVDARLRAGRRLNAFLSQQLEMEKNYMYHIHGTNKNKSPHLMNVKILSFSLGTFGQTNHNSLELMAAVRQRPRQVNAPEM